MSYAREVPWYNTELWLPGYWYPLTSSHDVEYLGAELTVYGAQWGLFKLDPRFKEGDPLFGDTVSIGHDMAFQEAFRLANELNPTKLWTCSWIKEQWAQPDKAREIGG